jgi:hypothetical protein
MKSGKSLEKIADNLDFLPVKVKKNKTIAHLNSILSKEFSAEFKTYVKVLA